MNLPATQDEINRELFPLFRALERQDYLEQLLLQRRILGIVQRGDRPAVPIVEGHLLYDRATSTRIVCVEIRCPWCGCRHTHGAGPRPGDGNGHRYSHCT